MESVKRGDVWTVSGGPAYLGKPRPAVVLQDDRFDALASVTVCAFKTDPTDAPLFRLPVEPSSHNGLAVISQLMVDKITMVSRSKLGAHIGRLDDGPDPSQPRGRRLSRPRCFAPRRMTLPSESLLTSASGNEW